MVYREMIRNGMFTADNAVNYSNYSSWSWLNPRTSAYIEAMVIFNHIFGHQSGEQQQQQSSTQQQQQRGGQAGQQQHDQQGQRRRRSVPHLSGDHTRNEKIWK